MPGGRGGTGAGTCCLWFPMSVQVVELVFGLWSNAAMIAVGKTFLCAVSCCHPAAGQPDDRLMLNVYWLWLIVG